MINLPPGDRLTGFDRPSVAISPDGSHIAYVAIRGDTQQLYLRGISNLEAKPITGFRGWRESVLLSGQPMAGLSAGGKLKKIALAGERSSYAG